MSHDNFELPNEEGLTDEFESHLEAVVSEIYPTLCDRIAHSGFAGWHRRLNKAEDLAQQATFQFLRHCKRKQVLPADPLRYLVATDRNIAQKAYARSKRKRVEFEKYASELRARGEPTTDDASLPDALTESEAHIEIFRAALDSLPRRQREAVELRTLNPGDTDKELGSQMGINEDGFRKNFKRAYDRLKGILLRVKEVTNH